jgi:hypothetical protein
MKDEYSIYLEKYSKVMSGGKIEQFDFFDGKTEYDVRCHLAVSLATEHAKVGVSLKSKNELIKEIDAKMNQ